MANTEQQSTRDRLLQAAAEVMWEKSFQSASVDELCLRAKAKKGSFYHFFSSKTELAIAAIEDAWSQVRSAIFESIFNEDNSGLIQIQDLVDTVDSYQGEAASERGSYLGCPFGNLGQEMARQDEQIRAALQNIFDEHYDYLEGALNKARQANEIPAGDNRQRAKNIFALLEGGLLLAKVNNDPQTFRNVARAVNAVAAS